MRKLLFISMLSFLCGFNVHASDIQANSAYQLIYESTNLDGHVIIPECNPGDITNCPCNVNDVALFSYEDFGDVVANVDLRNTFVNAIAVKKFSEVFPSGDTLQLGTYKYSGMVKLPAVPRQDLAQVDNGEAVHLMIQFWDGRDKNFAANDSTLEGTLYWELNPWSPDSGKIKIYTHELQLVETGIIIPPDTNWHSFELIVNLETYEYVSLKFDDQFADLEARKLAKVHHPDWGDDISLTITTESMNTYPGPNCGNIFVWATSFKNLRFGAVTDSPCLLGDVNKDGEITPGDALCAFEVYLNQGSLDPESECLNDCAYVNADIDCIPNGVTPGDALIIFESYLAELNPPLDCVMPSVNKSSNPVVLKLPHLKEIRGESVEIPVLVFGDLTLRAFGFEFSYPSDLLSFEGVRNSAATDDWEVLDGNESQPGSLVIGGFNNVSADFERSGVLFNLLFKVKENRTGTGEFLIHNTVDDVAGADLSAASISINENQQLGANSHDLLQNYPNPFNMSTGIAYDLPEDSSAKLKIFNTLGQTTRTLIHEDQKSGRHLVYWYGRDDDGKEVSAGIYIYRLETSKYRSEKKMILMK